MHNTVKIEAFKLSNSDLMKSDLAGDLCVCVCCPDSDVKSLKTLQLSEDYGYSGEELEVHNK